jgi:predicted thioesterase
MDVGDIGEARLVVGPGDSAKGLSLSPEDDFPDVFATSRMIALMELAAARLMRPGLGEGQLSVGVGVDVQHLAATPAGIEVRAVATFLGMEGKLYRFKVEAFDAGGIVGQGHHTRAIVRTDRLLAGALSRNTRSTSQSSTQPPLIP